MKVWIDQDLCTGDGLCEEIAPDVFTLLDDGLAYVIEVNDNPNIDAGYEDGILKDELYDTLADVFSTRIEARKQRKIA